MTIDPRIMAKVRIEPIEDGCWIWFGKIDMYNQPTVTREQRSLSLRRVMYEQAIGPIPRKRYIAVPCDDRRCVNPAHLRAVTRSTMIRMAQQRGVEYGNPAAREKVIQKARARSPYTWDDVHKLRAIVASGIPTFRAAGMVQMPMSTAYKIARCERWQEPARCGVARLAQQAGMLP